MAEGFRIAAAYVQVSPDTSGFKEELEEQLEEATAGVHADVSVGLDTDELDAQVEEVKEKLAQLDGMRVTVSVGIEKADFDAGADEVKGDVSDLDALHADPSVGMEKSDFDAKQDEVKGDMGDLDALHADPSTGMDKSDFDAKADEIEARMAQLNSLHANPSVGGGGGSGSGGGDGSLLGAATLGLGAIMPGLGGAAMGLGALGGTAALAFGGISKTLSAAYQSSQNVGLTQAQMASTTYDNAVAVRQAQENVQQSFMQSAESAVSSAQQIEQSQMNLGTVERNAAQAQIQAVQGVVQAQQGLEEANFALSSAQYNLSNAWIQARYQLEQLEDQEKDSSTTIAAATLAVQQAQYQQLLTDQNAYSTSLDRQQAAISVTQAQEALTAAQQNATYVQSEYNLQQKYGVAGSQTVLTAQQAVTAAQYGQKNAVTQLSTAQLSLTDTTLNNAEQIKAAQLGVTEAQEQAAWSQAQNALSVKEAQQNLTSTIKEQQLQWKSTESTANAAANEYQKYFAKLSPAGKNFVNQVMGMRKEFRGLESDAQTATLPGFTQFLTGVSKLMPSIDRGVKGMGNAISNAFGQFGKQMQSKSFAHVFDGLITNGIRFANIVLPAFAQFIQELAKLGSGKGAADGLANLLAGIANGLTGMARSLKPYIPEINQFLTAVGKILTAMGPALGHMVGLVAEALGPLSRYLDSHPNGTVVKIIANILSGLLIMKGLQKIIPDALLNPLTKLGGSGAKFLTKPFADAAKALPGVIKDTFGPAMSSAGTYIAKLGSSTAKALSSAASSVGTWASNLGSTIASGFQSAGTAVGQFAATVGRNLVNAGRAVITWLGENLTAGATFIAENVAEAAAATTAFIAENAAMLGIGVAITLLIAGIVLLATHWSEVWGDIKKWAEDAWNFIYNGFGKWLLPLLGPAGLIALGVIEVAQHWQSIWGTIKSVTADVLSWIRSAFDGFISDVALTWDKLETIFKTPVNFLISTVYDDGIRRFWNDVVSAVGLKSLDLPKITPLAGGGVLPGFSPGNDTVPAMLSPGESVLTPQATKAIGPGTVHALNSAYPSSSSSSSSGSSNANSSGSSNLGASIAKMPLKEAGHQARRRLTEQPVEHAAIKGASHFAGGGVLGDLTHIVTGLGSDILSGAKFASEMATDPAKAVTDLLGGSIKTDATTGNMIQLMEAIPKTLVGDLGKAIESTLGIGSNGKLPDGSSSASGGLPSNWKTIATYLSENGFSKFAAAGVAGNIDAESGGNPEILEYGGGGGGGLIQWTPYPDGYITGDVQKDLMTQLQAVLTWGGGPALVNRATSPSNAAQIYQDYYEKPANLSASLPQRMASANAVYSAMGWGKYDSGGWMMPGGGGFNQTGQPEAVLDPQQSQALMQLTRQAAANGGGTKQAVFNFYGTQFPTPEQQAQMRRDLTMTLSGV